MKKHGQFVQTLRQLAWDLHGAPTDQLHAVDIFDHWESGYEFFRDQDRFHIDFAIDDMMHPGEKLKGLEGSMDVILVNQILHQRGIENQTIGASNLINLSRAKRGSLILGYQAGVRAQRDLVGLKGSKYRSLLHSPESWRELWDEAGRRTGRK